MISLRDMGVEEVRSQRGHRRGRSERGCDFGRSRANGRASRLLAAGADVENKWLDWESQIRSPHCHRRGRIERGCDSGRRANGQASRLLAAGADVENKQLDGESQIRIAARGCLARNGNKILVGAHITETKRAPEVCANGASPGAVFILTSVFCLLPSAFFFLLNWMILWLSAKICLRSSYAPSARL